MKLNFTNTKFIYLFIFIFSFILYSNSISNGYSFDDNLITDNFNKEKTFSDFFTSFSFVKKGKGISFAYRPVVLSSFAIENYFVNNNPHVSHFVNVLLYAIISVLIFYFLSLLFPDTNKLIFLLTVIIFIIHPLHTEPVNNIKSRDELLVGLFGFLSLIQYLKFLKTKKIFHILLLIMFALLGIFSKLSILVYLALIPIIYLLINKKIKVKDLLIILFILLFSYVFFRITKKHILNHDNLIRTYEYYENPLYYQSFFNRIPAGFSVVLYYFSLLINPFELSFYYGFDVIPINDWTNILPYFGILLFAGLIYLFFKLLRKNPFISFGIAILILNGFAVSNILIPLPGIVAERFFFLGVLGYAIILSFLIFQIIKQINWINIENNKIHFKPIAILVLFILLVPFNYKTFSRNKDWDSTETLFKADIPHLKNSAKANESIGSIYLEKFRKTNDRNMLTPAKEYYEQCVIVYPKYAAAWNNLGFINRYFGNLTKAEESYLKANKYNPDNIVNLFNLAVFYQAKNNIKEAKIFYKEAICIDPDVPNLIPYLKTFIIKNNLADEFIPFIEECIKNKENYNLQLLLIDLYNFKKDYNSMLKQLNKTYKKYPNNQLKKYIETVNNIFKK
jgi:tetratricopeptide (TPR) repeat protein